MGFRGLGLYRVMVQGLWGVLKGKAFDHKAEKYFLSACTLWESSLGVLRRVLFNTAPPNPLSRPET